MKSLNWFLAAFLLPLFSCGRTYPSDYVDLDTVRVYKDLNLRENIRITTGFDYEKGQFSNRSGEYFTFLDLSEYCIPNRQILKLHVGYDGSIIHEGHELTDLDSLISRYLLNFGDHPELPDSADEFITVLFLRSDQPIKSLEKVNYLHARSYKKIRRRYRGIHEIPEYPVILVYLNNTDPGPPAPNELMFPNYYNELEGEILLELE